MPTNSKFCGAEAIVEKKKNLALKTRLKKSYRIAEIDTSLRKRRTKQEASILGKLDKHVPQVERIDQYSIAMQWIEGDKAADALTSRNTKKWCEKIGKALAYVHDQEIIHGDLTTSNIILHKEVFFVDFGLGQYTKRVEDKAVDIHLFFQALEAKHHRILEPSKTAFLKGYKQSKHAKEVLDRLAQVERRGRNKTKF